MKTIGSSTILLTVVCGIAQASIIPWIGVANAQVVPDGTVGTTVNAAGNSFTINNGTRSGNNLFHSFSQFSVPTNGSVIFNNETDVQNIFSRVTGSSASTIDGLMKANGTASLFLMNPNGIVFGPNATLELGGSFVGTTANSIKFEDGIEFSVGNLTANPLLSVKVPIGLQMGSNPGEIINQSGSGLFGQPNRTIALIANGIQFYNGGIYAPMGQVEIGSVGAGAWVNLDTSLPLWIFNYGNNANVQNIQLSQQSLIDTEDESSGPIHLIGRKIELNQSGISSLTLTAASGGDIRIDALESLSLNDSYIVNHVLDGQQGGALFINTPHLKLSNQSGLNSISWGEGNAGNVEVRANLVQVTQNSGLGSFAGASGRGGNVSIYAQDVEVNGVQFFPDGSYDWSAIAASAWSTGTGGTVHIDTQRLILQDGGVIGASTFDSGNAGIIDIRATDSIQILGTGGNAEELPSAIRAEVRDQATGNGGSIFLTTGKLIISDGGKVSVNNPYSGNAGDISLKANEILLKNQGKISADVGSGDKGNIQIKTNMLSLRSNSAITTNASGNASGGNILIDSRILIGLENSDIIANAVQGKGGAIQIITQGLLGLQYRDRLTLDNDITASSEFGINGTVQVNTIGINPANDLNALPVDTVDSSRQIADRCASSKTGSFISTGRGGIPRNPMQVRKSDRPWKDIRPTVATVSNPIQPIASVQPTTQLLEASTIEVDETGVISLVAPQRMNSNPATCALSSQH
jgi:filamentous hemagglutinin family protein